MPSTIITEIEGLLKSNTRHNGEIETRSPCLPNKSDLQTDQYQHFNLYNAN